jgi:hypothetical protein
MTTTVSASLRASPAPRTAGWSALPGLARIVLVFAILASVAAAYVASAPDATAQADPDLTRLLRAMAALKALMAAGAAAAVLWRLGAAITLPWLAAYAMACGAMAAGPVVIWGMAHVGLGAVLLHGGLLATVLLLWRDPVVSARLSAIVATRRAALRAR